MTITINKLIQKFRRCKKCGEVKVLGRDFPRAKNCTSGHTYSCKTCVQKMVDPEKRKATQRAWRKSHANQINAYQREYRARKKKAAIATDCNPTTAAQGVETEGKKKAHPL